MNNNTLGKIITFYSYKGGTGRTMALANTACLLARRLSAKQDPQPNRPRVVAIDWDFEAPGLHRYFQPYFTTAAKFPDTPGCLDLFHELAETRSAYNLKDFVGNRQRALKDLERLDFERYLLETTIPGLSIIKSGRYDAEYAKQVSQFDWDEMFHATLGLFSGFTDFLRARFDYVLVDSRTGITDTSGICTMLLPDKLVVVFTPNQQSFTGIDELVRKAVAYRKNFPDGRPLTVFPLPSRIEMARPQLFEVWRRGPGSETTIQPAPPPDLVGYQPLFEELFRDIYCRPEINLTEYFNEVVLQQIPDYAYDEPIAVELETGDSRIFLRRSYEAFVDRLVELDVPWQSLAAARKEREILRRCDEVEEKITQREIEDGLRLSYTLLEQKPPQELFSTVAQAILDIAKAAYPQARQGASALIRASTKLALSQKNIDVVELAEVLRKAGQLCLEFDDYKNARHCFEASREYFEQAFGEKHPATLAAKTGLIRTLYLLGLYDEAQALKERTEMNILFPQTDEAWNPYIGVQGIASIDPLTLASAALRAALIDKAIRQAESISDVLQRRDMTRFPAVVQSLDLETGGLATNRLDNMLCALKRFLTEPHHADVREKLSAALRPMDSWVRGRYSVTSPALLVIQAILYSHCEWSREHLFEAYSARRAFEELDILGFPEQDKSFIAALIAHQTLLRTSWSTDKKRDPKEVLAFYRDDDGKVKFVGENGDEEGKAELMADRSVGQALAKTLFRFLPIQTSQPSSPDSQQETYSQQAAVVDNQQETIPLRRRQLAAALILHSLCLSCRHSHIESGMLKELKVQALGFLDHILAAGSTKKLYQYCLAFFQYGRHVYQAQSDTDKTTLLDDAKNIIIEHFKGQNSLTNVSLCFQRVSTHRVWLGVTQVDSPDLDLEKQPNPQDIHRISEIWDLVERTVGSVWKLSLKPEIYFLKALGLDSSDQEFKNLLVSWLKSETKTCEVLSELLKKIQQGSQRLPRDNYYPAPLVGQVLRQMRDARPELFTPLRIITRSAVTPAAMPSVGDTSFTVWLPKIVPIDSDKIVDPNAVVVWTGNSIDPNLLIARYVASMIIGRAVSFAPREILLDYYSEDTRHKWGKIIDRALYENGGPAMRTYISQLGCEPTAFRSLEVIETLHVSVSQKERQAVIQNRYILGIDIGGTSIKMLRFRVGDLNNSSEGEQIPLKRDNDLSLISVKGKNPKEVAEVAEVIENIVGSCESNPFENCVAVGVSLPCPVSSQQPRVPQAPTYSLHSLFNTQKDITKANPLDFHKLDFAKAITERYPTIKIVSVLNDGNADIRDGEDDLTISTHEGTTVVLKAGTGVAFAVYHDKKPVELKAETAKAPLNLCAKPQLKIPDERFQQGTIREFCSKDGLKRLTCNVLFDEVKHKNFFDNPGELIGPILTKALAGEKIDFGYSGGEMQVPLEPNAATDFNSMLEIFKINKNSDELKKIYRRAMDIGRQRRISKVKKKIDEWQKNQDIELADFENETKDWGKDIGQDTFDQFSDLQMFALGCAWILGGWLADAIAQVVDIYGAREIRLAGGPLSGAMGLLVAASAEKALETAYSFDLDVVSDPQRIDYMTSHGQPLALHHIREVKRLRLVYPSEDSGIGGPRGAAKAALDAWIKYEKQDELRRCRDWVNEKFNRGDSFNAKKLKKVAAQDKPISLISDTEVELMLAKEVSALGLTRSPGGKFRKL